jgi:heparin binding hemagglutinin HbhA
MTFSGPEPHEAPAAAKPAPTGHPHNPLLAALGAGEAAVAAVARAFAEAFSAAASTQKTVQQRVAELPAELDGLRGRFSGEELRRALEAYRAQVERTYAEFAGRGEEAWGRLRERPQVRQAMATLESYTGKLDARVDELVDDAQDAATRALAAAGRQTRATGEKVARAGQLASGRAADAVVETSAATSEAVEEAGTAAAAAIEDAGEETATVTRKATRGAVPRRTTRRSGPASE